MKTHPPGMKGAALALLTLFALAACGGRDTLQQPAPLYGEAPIEYPIELWDEGAEGVTLLRVLVNDVGEVEEVEVAESSGHAGLDTVAVEGARALRFEPGRKGGKRVKMWASLPVHFVRDPSRPPVREPDQ